MENYVNNLFNNEDDIKQFCISELEHIKYLDNLGNIKCYDFIKQNFNKIQLFYNRSYPTYFVFHHIAQQILNFININDIIYPIFSSYAINNLQPIYPQVKKVLNIKFNIEFNINCNLIEYILCCKKNKVNWLLLSTNKKRGIKYLNDLHEIITIGKFR